MPPRLHIVQRARIIALWQTGARISDICRTMGVTKRTVYWWVRRFEEEGEESLEDRPRLKKRKRATTADEDRAILELHMKDGMSRTKETAAKYNISMQTVRRRLHEGGLKLTNPIQRKTENQLKGPPMATSDTRTPQTGCSYNYTEAAQRGCGAGVARGGARARRGPLRRGTPRTRGAAHLGHTHLQPEQSAEGPGEGAAGPAALVQGPPGGARESEQQRAADCERERAMLLQMHLKDGWEARRPQPYDWQRPGTMF